MPAPSHAFPSLAETRSRNIRETRTLVLKNMENKQSGIRVGLLVIF